MNPKWNKIKEIFSDAAEIQDPADRERWLENACDGDPEVYREVKSLLDYLTPNDRMFMNPRVSFPIGDKLQAGTRIDKYEIIRDLDEGGMGEIYLAKRVEDFHQTVAIKCLKKYILNRTAFADNFVERFHEERQILANLKHPDICGLLDGGTSEDGCPYLVMEYVEGIPIDAFCRKPGFGLKAKLELVRKVQTP